MLFPYLNYIETANLCFSYMIALFLSSRHDFLFSIFCDLDCIIVNVLAFPLMNKSPIEVWVDRTVGKENKERKKTLQSKTCCNYITYFTKIRRRFSSNPTDLRPPPKPLLGGCSQSRVNVEIFGHGALWLDYKPLITFPTGDK